MKTWGNRNQWRLAAVGLALLVALAASPAPAAEEAPEPAAPAAVDQVVAGELSIPVTVAGMQVSIDPKTGRLRPPTPAEARALAAAFQQTFGANRLASKQAVIHKSADGMLTAQVDFSLLDHYVAEVQADGTVVTRCVDGAGDAAHHHGSSLPEEK